MALQWLPAAETLTDQTPYVHWWEAVDRLSALGGTAKYKPQTFAFSGLSTRSKGHDDPMPHLPFLADGTNAGGVAAQDYATDIPIPAHAYNAKFNAAKTTWEKGSLKDVWDGVDVPDDAVLVGVVDVGIALGHRRFWQSDGKTRIVSAWQQAGDVGQSRNTTDNALPFGTELFSPDIDRLIGKHSTQSGMDEDAFNLDAGLVQPALPGGQRDLEYAAAHGTHITDLAAGYDPDRTSKNILANQRIIAVNLPPQRAHGSAGHFLVYWALYAIERILYVADELWLAKASETAKATGKTGYPLVINFSFGQQAGPKDGSSPFEQTVRALLNKRNTQVAGKSPAPTRLIMPVGNSNTYRNHARTTLTSAAPIVTLPWRIQPSDQTSNFVEMRIRSSADTGDVTLQITPPGVAPLQIPQLRPGAYAVLKGPAGLWARVYRRRDPNQQAYVVCVAPTDAARPGQAEAPAGLWTLHVESHSSSDLDVTFDVQSDQSGDLHSKTGLRSYFETPNADPFHSDGRLRDYFDYDTDTSTDTPSTFGPIQMAGSQNALGGGAGDDVVLVAGHRATDGRPAIYSSAYRAPDACARQALDVSLPSEDGAAHFGVLASGARDGSVVAMRGTSMAAGMATRHLAQAMAGWNASGGNPPDATTLQAAAEKCEDARPGHWNATRGEKSGRGRMDQVDQRHGWARLSEDEKKNKTDVPFIGA